MDHTAVCSHLLELTVLSFHLLPLRWCTPTLERWWWSRSTRMMWIKTASYERSACCRNSLIPILSGETPVQSQLLLFLFRSGRRPYKSSPRLWTLPHFTLQYFHPSFTKSNHLVLFVPSAAPEHEQTVMQVKTLSHPGRSTLKKGLQINHKHMDFYSEGEDVSLSIREVSSIHNFLIHLLNW